MKIENSSMPCVISTVRNHEQIKESILKCIDEDPAYTSFQNVTRTDWGLPQDYKRNYADHMQPIMDCLGETYAALGYTDVQVANYWFQQYDHNGSHNWHTHPGLNFTNIYFLELPDNTSTMMINPLDNTVIVPDVKEGDVLTFPAHIIHQSPPNTSGKRKTVLVINLNVEYISE